MFKTFLLFILGLEFGSFANVCIYRWPRNKSISSPVRSHCPWCDALIPWHSNIPILSFLWLRARCGRCHSPISWRYPFIELLCGSLWVGVYFLGKNSFTLIEMLPQFLLLWGLIVGAAVDFEWKIIPDEVSCLLIIGGVLLSFINPLLGISIWERGAHSLIGAFAGIAMLWALGNLGAILFKQPAMGGGDIKLLGGIGAILGWKGIFVSLFAASIGGAIFSLIGIVLKQLKPREYIPFGPFLSGGAILALVLRLFSGKFS